MALPLNQTSSLVPQVRCSRLMRSIQGRCIKDGVSSGYRNSWFCWAPWSSCGSAVTLIFQVHPPWDHSWAKPPSHPSCSQPSGTDAAVFNVGVPASTVLMGKLKGNTLTTAATGLMAGTRTKQRLFWKYIRKVKDLDRQMTILLYSGFGETTAVFCTEENDVAVRQDIENWA